MQRPPQTCTDLVPVACKIKGGPPGIEEPVAVFSCVLKYLPRVRSTVFPLIKWVVVVGISYIRTRWNSKFCCSTGRTRSHANVTDDEWRRAKHSPYGFLQLKNGERGRNGERRVEWGVERRMRIRCYTHHCRHNRFSQTLKTTQTRLTTHSIQHIVIREQQQLQILLLILCVFTANVRQSIV